MATTRKSQRKKSVLALACDAAPLRNTVIAEQLGYTIDSWGQVRMGLRRLPDHKLPLLAELLGVSLAEARRLRNKTFASEYNRLRRLRMKKEEAK